jgi:hypothetical protein
MESLIWNVFPTKENTFHVIPHVVMLYFHWSCLLDFNTIDFSLTFGFYELVFANFGVFG